MKLTVYYDDQFWVGVVEEIADSKLMAARYVFGTEPHDTDVLWFINHKMMEFLASSKPLVCAPHPKIKSANPKKLARQVAKEMQSKGISTYSQEAIKENLKSRKVERRIESKLQREELAEKKRKIATLKAKAKHRGK
ncbi:YjdF family protein [Desulfosporosinus sp. FKA]|uniref:YjdF family protein n=1 Tax=Desulfosporosinus sp. FKA TaxID=1969834 RepID=UPI000B49FF74|nr:YjdF family protein [Desulfosporosinus sp. FKA]